MDPALRDKAIEAMVATILDDGTDLEHELGGGVDVQLRYGRTEFALDLYFHDDSILVDGPWVPLSFERPILSKAVSTELGSLIARVRSAAGRLDEHGPTTPDDRAAGAQDLRVDPRR